MPDQPDDRPRLGDQHYGVSLTAARTYAAHEQIEDEREAKAELERILSEARQSATNPNNYRLRSKTTGLDISVFTRFDEERGHRVVTSLNIRETGAPVPRERRPPSYERRQLRRAAERETVQASGVAAPLEQPATAAPSPSAAPGLRFVHLARDHRSQPLCGAPRDAGTRLVPLTMERFVAPQIEQLDRITAASRGAGADLAELGLVVRAVLDEQPPHRCPACWRKLIELAGGA